MKNKESLTETYLIQALIELIEKKPFDKITITDIAEKAGVSRITFYRHFNSKTDIIDKKNKSITEECIKKTLIENDAKSIEEYIFYVFNVLFKNKKYLKVLYKERLDMMITLDLDKALYKYGTHNTYRRIFYTGGFFNILLEWIKNDFKDDPKEMVKEIMYILKQDP